MVHQQKRVQQETAYSAVVVNDHNMYPCPCLYHVSMTHFWVKNDIGTGIHMIIHYNCVFADVPSLYPFIS